MTGNAPLRRARFAASWIYAILTGLCLVPGVNGLVVWLLPVPLILFHVTGLRRATPAFAMLSTVCLFVSGFNWSSVLIGLALYFLSWVVGDSMQDVESAFAPLITGTLVFLMLELVLLALARWAGVDLFNVLSTQVSEALMRNQALLGGDASQLKQIASQEIHTIRIMLPGILCVGAFLAASVNVLVTRWILRGAVEQQPLLLNWQLPYGVVAIYVICVAIVLFGWTHSSPFVWQAINSAMFLGGFLLGIQGLAFLWRRLYQRQLSYLWLTGLIVLSMFIGNLFVLLGLVDSMIRARRA